LVVETEFRGSDGFGTRHLKAGFKEWGLKMQDDVADATEWAVKSGLAQAGRICIAGASYGGYATLMGLLRYPDLYRCGFEWVGVTDIGLMYSISWSDLSDAWLRYGLPVLVGDPDKDAERLKATSPLYQAEAIRQPILMAYGGADRRVPIEHGRKFRAAVERHNKAVEWIEYPTEGHGWLTTANEVDFWGRVEKFLDRNIGSKSDAAHP
jgi:dipeptidyl aminopeptidase/acylaminoacyl peptidase